MNDQSELPGWIGELIRALPNIPIEHLNAAIALGAIALSAWSIRAVTQIARDKK